MVELIEYERGFAIVAAAAGASAGLFALWKHGRRVFRWFFGRIAPIYKLPTRLSRLEDQFDEILTQLKILVAEVQVNGGSSLRDMLNIIGVEHLAEIGTRRLMFSRDIAFWESDKDGQCIFASDKLAEYLDQNPHDILGDGWLSTVHPDDRERVAKSWFAAVEDKRMFIETYRFVHDDGKIVTCQGHCHPVKSPRNEIVKFVGMLTKK